MSTALPSIAYIHAGPATHPVSAHFVVIVVVVVVDIEVEVEKVVVLGNKVVHSTAPATLV